MIRKILISPPKHPKDGDEIEVPKCWTNFASAVDISNRRQMKIILYNDYNAFYQYDDFNETGYVVFNTDDGYTDFMLRWS